MDAAVQAFKDKMAERSEAKAKCVAALGRATLTDNAKDWEAVAQFGVKGDEGRCNLELQAMADAYVKAHPEQFAAVVGSVNAEGHEQVVKLIDLYYGAGMEESALALTMFELASFERQEIGVATRAKVRLGNSD